MEGTELKSLFEEMGGTYAKVGDYNLPKFSLPEVKTKPIGLWSSVTQGT